MFDPKIFEESKSSSSESSKPPASGGNTAQRFNAELAAHFATSMCAVMDEVEAKEEKRKELQHKAESGDAEAQYNFAKEYLEGQAKIDMLTQSAEQGYVDAQVALGEIYSNISKSGISGNLFHIFESGQKACEWYIRAAAQGDFFAKCHLASNYRKKYESLDSLQKVIMTLGILEQKEIEYLNAQSIEVLKEAFVWASKASLHPVSGKVRESHLDKIQGEKDAIASILKQRGVESVSLETTRAPEEFFTPKLMEIITKLLSKLTSRDPKAEQILTGARSALAQISSKITKSDKVAVETKDGGERASVGAEAVSTETAKTSVDEAQTSAVESAKSSAEAAQTPVATKESDSEPTTIPVATLSSIRPSVM